MLTALALNWPRHPPSSFSITLPGYSHATTPMIRGWNDPRFVRREGEDDWRFIKRLNGLVNSSYYHCRFDEITRPVDWLALKLFGRNDPTLQYGFKYVGYLLPENRCGFCHQSAFILANFLTRGGIPAEALGLNGHVVTFFTMDEKLWIIDPDIGLGPYEYRENMWQEMKDDYLKLTAGDPALFRQFAAAFTDLLDDRLYLSREELRDIERIQRKYIIIAEQVTYAVGVAGLVLMMAGLALLHGKDSGQK